MQIFSTKREFSHFFNIFFVSIFWDSNPSKLLNIQNFYKHWERVANDNNPPLTAVNASQDHPGEVKNFKVGIMDFQSSIK